MSTWVHAWLFLHKISKSSLLHVCHGNNVGHPLYPWTAGQTHTLTYIMSSRSTSLEPKSQLTINLDPGWECPSSPSEGNKKKGKFPIKDRKKAKEKNKNKQEQKNISFGWKASTLLKRNNFQLFFEKDSLIITQVFGEKNVYAPERWMLWKLSQKPKMDSNGCMNW